MACPERDSESVVAAVHANFCVSQQLISRNLRPFCNICSSREDVAELLEQDGDFLLRKELINDGLLIAAISVRCADEVKHFMINQSPQGDFYVERIRARTIEELITETFSLGKHHSVEEFIGELVQNNITRPVFLKTIGISCSREARLLRSLCHENVGETYGIALHYSPIILVLEYFNTSLFTHLRRNAGRISPREKRRFVCEAAAGLSYLAQLNYIHRDIRGSKLQT
ncbi:SH2 domain protein [Cooperia oncophora]